jgi:hypothetical protein
VSALGQPLARPGRPRRLRLKRKPVPAHVAAGGRRATLEQAQHVAAPLWRALRPLGYDVALYGSTLRRGAGRDFDFMAWPRRLSAAGHGRCIEALRNTGLQVSELDRGAAPSGGSVALIAGVLDGYPVHVLLQPAPTELARSLAAKLRAGA